MIHGDVRGMSQLVDLEGEPVRVTGNEEDDDADQNDCRFLATTLKKTSQKRY